MVDPLKQWRFDPSKFNPGTRGRYSRAQSPAPSTGGPSPIAGASDYADARRKAQIALDQYGYALTDDEREDLGNQDAGTGLMDGVFDLLEAPLNTVKYGLGLFDTKQDTNPLNFLGALWTSDDDAILRAAPHLEGEDGEANLSMAAVLRGDGKSPDGFGEKAKYATSGIALDILLDPLSWVSFGTLGLGRTLAKEGAEAALKTSAKEATEALVRNNLDTVTDPLSKRLANEIEQGSRPLRDELFEKVKKVSGDLDEEATAKLRTAVDEEVFMHEADRAATLVGEAATGAATRADRWSDEVVEIFDEALDEGSSLIQGTYNRTTALVADKQFGTLAREMPEFVQSSYSPVHSTGGVTLTTPFFRKQMGGVKLGMRTDRAVTRPIRLAATSAFERLPANSRVRRGVQALWSRRGVDVANRKIASAGKAWELSHAKGAAESALRAMDATDSSAAVTQSLRRVVTAANENGEDVDETLRIFGSVLDGETKLADLKAAPGVLSVKTVEAIEEAHGVARSTLDTIHKALTEFDPSIGYIDDYFPLMASSAMGQLLESMADGAKAIPLDQMLRHADAMADPKAAARLRVGAQILAFWSSTTKATKVASDGRVVLDHSRFMNQRLLGKTVFSSWGEEGLNLANKAEITRILGESEDITEVGWSSRSVLNDAVRSALEFMEGQGTIKLPKEFDPFSMDVPAVLDAYVKATERVLHFKSFVRASTQVKLVREAPEAVEVGLTLAKHVDRLDPETDEVLRAYIKYIDGARGKGLPTETETIRIGSKSIEMPKGMADIPRVRQAIDAARETLRKNASAAAVAKDSAEKRIQQIIKEGDLPREIAEEFAALASDADVRHFVSAMWTAHLDRVAAMRAAATEINSLRSADEVKEAVKELRRVEREWENGVSDAIADMADAWNASMGYSRYKSDGAVDMADLVTYTKNGEEVTQARGAVLADLIDGAIRGRLEARVNQLDPWRRAELGITDGMDLDALVSVVKQLDAEDLAETAEVQAFRAFQEIADEVEIADLSLAELAEEIGPLETYKLVESLAGYGSAPIVDDFMGELVQDMAEQLGGIPYRPRLVSSKHDVGDVGALVSHWSDEMVDYAPGTEQAFVGLAQELEQQIRWLEDVGFEFQTAPGRIYENLDDFLGSLSTRQVFIEPTVADMPPQLADISVTLGNGVTVPLVAALDTVHRIIGHAAHGYKDDVAGITNAWLSHSQMFPADRPDVLGALASLTRVRRIADQTTGRVNSIKMDIPEGRVATPWRYADNNQQNVQVGESIEGALEGGTGYGGGLASTPDKGLREANLESQVEQGLGGVTDPLEAPRAALNKEAREAELRNDRRKFSLSYRKEGMDQAEKLMRQIAKDYERIENAKARMPVKVWREGEAAIIVRLHNGQHKVFEDVDKARSWWNQQYRTTFGSGESLARGGPKNLPEPNLDNERYGSFLSKGEVREVEDEQLTFLEELDAETYNTFTPEVNAEGGYAGDPDLGRVDIQDEADRAARFERSLNPPNEFPTQKPSKKSHTVLDSAAGQAVAERADGSIEIFPNARAAWDEVARQTAYIDRARQGVLDKTVKFVDKMESEGITLKGLLEEPPPGLAEANLAHPLFTDAGWQGIIRAAYKKRGLDDAVERASARVDGWREAAEQIADGPGLKSLIEVHEGSSFTTPGAGVLSALRSGDTAVLASQESALRALIEQAGMDADRLIIERLGDGTHRVRWGAEKEFVSVDINQIRPKLVEALQGTVDRPERLTFRELIARAKANNVTSPELEEFLELATVKGNLPFDLEDYFYLQDLRSKIAIYGKAGRADLMDEVGGNALSAVVDALEPVLRTKGGGDLDALQEVWEANRAALAKSLTSKDYRMLEGLVTQAPYRKRLTTEALAWEKTRFTDKMYADASAALEALYRVKDDIYQEVSPYVRQHFHDAIESVDYFTGRYADLMSRGRSWRGKMESFEGFEPHYNQLLWDEADKAEFLDRSEELVEAGKRVRNDMLNLLNRKQLSGEREEFLDWMSRELGDVIPKDDDLEGWLAARIKKLGDPNRQDTFVPVNTVEGFVDQSQFGLAARELDGMIVDANVGLLMESMASHAAAMWTPQGVRLLREQMGAFERYWKAATTVARPTFVLRNMMGGIFNGMIADVGAREYKWVSTMALRVRNEMDRGASFEDALKILSDADADVFRAAKREGIFDMEFTSDLDLQNLQRSKSIKPWKSDFVLFDLGGRFMQRSEDFMRMAAFKRWYHADQAGSAGLAREMVNTVHFDYGNLTQFETKIKKLIPFYVWTRRNIPLQMRTLFERPAIANRYRILQQNVEASFSDEDDPSFGLPIPGWMGSQAAALGTQVHENDAWTRFIFSPDLPFKDFEQLLTALGDHESGPIIGGLEWAGNSMTPLVKIPMDVIRNSQYDAQVAAPIGMAQAFQVLDNIVNVGGRNAETGDFEVPYWMRSLYEGIVPFQREVLETAGVFQDDDRRAQRLGVAEADNVEAGERILASVLSLARSVGIRGQTQSDVTQDTIKLDESIRRIVGTADREGRILKDEEGNRLGREDLARIIGDPFEGQAPGTGEPQAIAIDGDTIIMENGERIRLAFMNTAELGEEGAAEAHRYLMDALRRGDIEVERTGFDEYGRTVGEVSVNGVNLSTAMVGAGFGDYIPAVHEIYRPVKVP